MNLKELSSDGSKFRIDQISNGDLIVAGTGRTMRCDAEKFNDVFKRADDAFNNLSQKKDYFQNIINKYDKGFPVNLFIRLLAFQNILNKYLIPADHNPNSNRDGAYYKSDNGILNLSDAFKLGVTMCTERAALAALYLNSRGVSVRYYAGNTFFDDKKPLIDGGDSHAFLEITSGGKRYVYDPTNPNGTGIPSLPYLPALLKSFMNQQENEMFEQRLKAKDKFSYFRTKDIFTNRIRLYGFNGAPKAERNSDGVFGTDNPDVFNTVNNSKFQNS